MAAPKDFYKTLGVAETAGADEIKKAYRKLAKKYHPDATGGDKAKEARFKDASEAYEVLGDDKKRAAYDEQRRNPFAGRMPGGGGPGGGGFQGNVDLGDLFSQFKGARGGGGAGGGGFSDIFEMFGGGGAAQQTRRGPRRGEDVVARFEIELPDAALGAEKEIIVEGRHLKIKIPPGVTDGKTIRLAGQGQPGSGRGASAGDLLIELHEKPHARFRRRAPASADIEVELPISVDIAVLGGKADVITLEGTTVSLTIPAGTSSGRQLRLRGKGAYVSEGTRGDLFAVASVQVPSELTPQAKDLFTEFARLIKK